MISKSKLCLILTSFVAAASLSCAPNMINNVLPTSNSYNSTGISFDEYKKREQNEILNKIRNKTDKNYRIESLIINTGMLNKSGKVFSLQSENIRTKKFILGQHPTNEDGKQLIFNPKDPQSLTSLQVYEGNSVDQNGNRVSSVKINENTIYNFEPDVVIVKFRTNNGLNVFKTLYNAEVLGELDGYYKLRIDVNKSPIEKTEELLEKLNTAIPENIKNIEFSSLSSMKLFVIMCDFLFNHNSDLENIEFNLYGENQTPIVELNDWKHRPDNPAIYNDGTGTEINSWWLTQTNVIFPFRNPTNITNQVDIGTSAWKYSIGTGIKVAVIDEGFNLEHPEYLRRLIKNESDNGLSHNVLDKDHVHGTEMSMIIGGEKNNGIGSIGVAPNVTISPYFRGVISWDSATRLKSAVANGAQIVNYSLTMPNDILFKAAEIWTGIFSPQGNFEKQIKDAVENKKVTFITAAGNNAKPIDQTAPAFLSDVAGVIVVGGVDIIPRELVSGELVASRLADYTASFAPKAKSKPPCNSATNIISTDSCNDWNGKGSGYGRNLVWAPWQNYAWASSIKDTNNTFPIQNYQGGGTSSGTAFTSGVASLLLSRNPNLTPQKLEEILHNTARTGNIIVKKHKYMDNFTDATDNMYLINAKTAVEQAIRDRNDFTTVYNSDISKFEAKDLGIGYFKLDNNALNGTSNNNQPIGTLTLNDGNSLRLLRTASDDEFTAGASVEKGIVSLKGWEPNISGISEGIEVLSVTPYKLISLIDFTVYPTDYITVRDVSGNIVSGAVISKDYTVELKGINLFALGVDPKIIFRRTLATGVEDYVMPIPRSGLIKDGTSVKFTFDPAQAIKQSDGTQLASGYEVEIAFQGNETSNFVIGVKNTTAFKVSSVGANQGEWTLKLFNSDDFINSYLLNGTSLVSTNNGEVREQNITSLLPSGNSQFQFDVENFGSGMTWGIELKKGNQVILRDVRGKYGSFGADNNSNYFSNYTSEYSINIPINKENGLLLPSSDWKIKLFNVSPGDTLNVYRYSNNSWTKIASSSDSNNLKIFRLSTFFNLATEKLMLEVVNPSGSYSYGFSLLRDGDEVYRNVVGDKYWGASENYPYTDNQNKTGTFSVKQTGSNTIELETSLELSYDQTKPLTMSQAPFPDGTVTFNGGISIPKEKFIDNEPFTKPIQANRNDVLGVALDGVNSLSDVVITIDGKQVTIQDIVNEYIAFKVPPDVSDGVKNIIISKINGSKTLTFAQALEILASAPVNISNSSSNDYNPRWSPDGTKILFSRNISTTSTMNRQIFTMNADGTNQINISNTNNVNDFSGVWSPDGTKIYFNRFTNNNINANIYYMNIDGTNKTNLTNYPFNGGYAITDFSPDGFIILTQLTSSSHPWNIYKMDSNGTNIVRLTYNLSGFDGNGNWSPDGNTIVFLRDINSFSQVFTINADGTNLKQLTFGNYNNDVPLFSGNGNFIISSSDKLGNWQIYKMNIDGTSMINLSNNSFNDITPSLNNGGTKLLFSSDRNGNGYYQIYTMYLR